MRIKALVAVGSALLLVVALAIAVVTLSGPAGPSIPVQQTGTAAGRPHRVTAAADLGRVVDGRFIPDASGSARPPSGSAGATGAGTLARVPGAVPAIARPKPLRLPASGKTAPATASVLKAPPAEHKAGFNQKTSVPQAPTSADQTVYSNADGTKTAFEYNNPVNYRRPNGTWASISTSLVAVGPVNASGGAMASVDAFFEAPATDSPSTSASQPPSPSPSGSASSSPSSPSSPSGPPSASPSPSASSTPPPADGWTEKSEAEPESFAASADAPALVTMQVDASHSVSFGISGADAAPGAASGSSVSYPGVRPDSTVSFTAGTGLVKESIVLSSPSAPSTWLFPLEMKGLKAEMGPGGLVEFADSAGKVLAYVPAGFMTDSDIDPHSGNGATSFGVTYSLVTADGRQAIKMTLDAGWLDSKSRVYPVTVDPSVSDYGTDGTTYVLSPYDNDYSGDSEIKVGTYDGGTNVAESYLDFSSVATKLQNDTVLGARLGLFNTWSYSCSPREVYVYPVTSSWSVTGDKSSGPSTGSAVGRSSFATGWVPYGSSSSPCPASWEGIDLDQSGTNLINGWTHGTVADNGLALGASNSDSYAWKKFASKTPSTGNPFLAITYTTDGASYGLASKQAVTNVTPTSAGKFAIKVTNTGSSTWDANNGNGYEIASTAYYAYGGKGKDGTEVPGSQEFTELPSTVAPGQSVTVDATVASLAAGPYQIVFDMYSGRQSGGTPESFDSQGIQDFEIGLYVPEPPPVVSAVYPPTGFISSTLQQQLSTTATGTGTVTYDFTLTCKPLAGQTCVDSSVTSGSTANPYWTPPEADLDWSTPYQWSVVVTSKAASGATSSTTVGPVQIEAEAPQPAITSDLGNSDGQDYDPLSGNYTTSATDAAVASLGPPLEIDRTYNSLDPRSSGAFGAGWSSVADTSLRNNGNTVTVTLPQGQQMTFGENGDGSYAAPSGSQDALVKSSSGTWTLRDAADNKYAFTSAGLISSLTDVNGYAEDFAYNASNQVTTISNAVSGRALTLTWSKPTGASYYHVSSVTTPAPTAGGSGYTWNYSYAGDELTQACAPAVAGSGCTTYTYGTGSHYWSSALDADPRGYYQLGESSGTTAADEVEANLGTTNGTYHNVTLGSTITGPLAGSSETAASFNGTSSYVSLPNDLITDSTDVSVGLWFKAASASADGVLFSYDTDAITNSSGSSTHRTPLLYIGTNGELYGEFYNGSVDPIHTSTSVTDGKWHYAVITAASNSQSLYLDGAQVGSPLSGQINQLNQVTDTIGAGFWNSWPSDTSTAASYFNGDIAQVAVYAQPLSGPVIASQHALATAASPELTQVTLPSGKVYEQASYDPGTARLTTYTDQDGGQWTISPPLATGTKASSDALGYVVEDVSVGDPAGRNETYGYDMTGGGRLISYDNGVDPPNAYGYDAAGFLTTVVNQDGDLACMTNDVHGNVLTRTWYPVEPATLPGTGPGIAPVQCGGSTTSSPGCTSSGAACTTFYGYTAYNAANPLDPTNDELTSVRDGRSASATDDTYETTYSYNTIGQLTLETTPATSGFPGGRTTRYAYSTGTESAANGGTIPAGLLESVATPGAAVTSYSYDSNGDLAQTTEPSGRYTDYAYDGLGRPLTAVVHTSTYPSGETTAYTYTPTGQQATVTYPAVTNAVANATHQLEYSYSYDDDNDVLTSVESDVAGGDPSRTTTYTYNDHDEVATVTQPAGATTGGTTQSDGAASENPDGATTGYDYDAFGDVTQVTDPDGNQDRYAYNEYQEPTQGTLYTPSANEASSVADCASPATQDPDGGCDLVLESDAYDPAGLLAATTDAMGRITNYAYDNDQELDESSTTLPCSSSAPCTSSGPCTPTAQCTSGTVGAMTTYSYDGAGNLVSQAVSATDGGAAGTTTTTDYTYDAADQVASEVQDATPSTGSSSSGYLNRTTAYAYDADNDVLSKTVGTGSALDVTDYGYNAAGNMTSQSVQDGSTTLETTWTYDQNGLPLSMTTPAGNASGANAAGYTTNYAYNPAGQLTAETGPPVSVSSYTSQTPTSTRPQTAYGYDTFGDQTQAVDPDGNVTTTAYDGDGRRTSVAQAAYTPPGTSSAITATTAYAYDEDGNLVAETDPEGNVTSATYDALGDVTSVTVPQLPGQSSPGTSTYTYDADGERLSATDPLGNTTRQTYDYFGNVATSTDPMSNTTKYAYDYLGDQTIADTPDGSVTTSTYDHLGELASVTDGAGDQSTYDYDDQGNLAYVYSPDGSFAQYGYDQAGRPTTVTDYGAAPAGQAAPQLRSESFGYDLDGDQTSATDWNGNTTTSSYNAAGELTGQVKPVSSAASIPTSYAYDAAGNRTSATSGNGNTNWTTYNPWNLPQSVIEPTTPTAPSASNTTWTTAYNADGEPSAVTEPGGVSLSYGYDPLGDITSESGSGATATTPARSFGYDMDQRMTSAAAGTGTDSFTYNGDSDQTAASGPSGTSSYTYNNDGLVASETGAAGKTSYTYDGADRLSTEAEPLTGATLTWAYNSDSDPTSISYATAGTAGPTQSFGYNSLQQVTSDTLTSGSGSTLASETYGYDADGNVTSQATGGSLGTSSTTYNYDRADRLTSAVSGGTTTGYAYDNDGNLTSDGSATNTYNAQDQLTSSASSAGTTDYSYTLNGEQASVTPPSSSATDDTWDAYGDLASAGSVSYGYDALGRLTSRTAGSGSATSLSYLGTSDTLASDGTSDYSYTPSGAVTGVQQSGGTAYTTMTDQHGDVIAAFSPTSAAQGLAGYSSYGPYGAKTSANYTENLGYQGDYTDPTTGLVYMNARWYNPATGTFTSSDTLGGTPIPATADANPYAYADGNPLTDTDPSGQGCLSGLGWLCSAAQTVFHFEESAYVNVGTCLIFGCASSLGDDDCPSYGCGYDGGGGSPAPTWLPTLPPYPSPSPSGQQPPGCDWDCTAHTIIGVGVAVGIGTIAGICADQPELCAVWSPPPPPVPPQDCYADGECKIPDAPWRDTHDPVVTDPDPAPKDPHVTIDEKPPTTTPKTPDGLNPGNDTNLPPEGGPGGGPPPEVPTTPEPPDPATGNTPGGPGNEPVTTPETPTTPDTTSTSDNSGSSGNGNPGAGNEEPEEGKGLSRGVKIGINAGLGGISAVGSDLLHGQRDPLKITEDGVIGTVTGSVGGLADKAGWTIFNDAIGGLFGSTISQGVDNGWSHINIGKVAFSTSVSGEAGALSFVGNIGEFAPLLKALGDNQELYKDLTYNAVYAPADLYAGICNVYGVEVEHHGC